MQNLIGDFRTISQINNQILHNIINIYQNNINK